MRWLLNLFRRRSKRVAAYGSRLAFDTEFWTGEDGLIDIAVVPEVDPVVVAIINAMEGYEKDLRLAEVDDFLRSGQPRLLH